MKIKPKGNKEKTSNNKQECKAPKNEKPGTTADVERVIIKKCVFRTGRIMMSYCIYKS